MTQLKWWQKAVFYQIYPRSFADGNGDGIGDFQGMIAKLAYLQDLGVDALWLSPHFPSPMWDCGYDISDYTAVAPEYGSLEDFRIFLEEAHRRGMHVILDMVLNHTSDQHAWFLESRSSRDNPKADWYIWEDPLTPLPSPAGRGGGIREPNNWQSCFDGPAWTYASERGQYYYHYFMQQQPDLNWHNPEVIAAMWAAVRFWLDLGVDGFRLDAIGTIFEHPGRPDHPVPMNLAGLRHFSDVASTPEEKELVKRYWKDMFRHQLGQPGLHNLMKELRRVLDAYPGDRMLVGEDDDVSYQGNGEDELQMVFNFPLMHSDRLTPARIRRNQRERLAALAKISPQAWAANTLGNHDNPRLHNRLGDGAHDDHLARLSLAALLTLKGTPFLYNGEEIGMRDLMLDDIAHFRDTMGTWYYRAEVDDLGVDPAKALSRAAAMTRDKNRTPMQWANAVHAGFCPANVQPWLPVHPNYAQGVNVQDQQADPGSLLRFYRRMLRVRKETPALVEGEYHPVRDRSREYLAFLRQSDSQTVLVVLNFSAKGLRLNLSLPPYRSLKILFRSSAGQPQTSLNSLRLAAFEIFIAELW